MSTSIQRGVRTRARIMKAAVRRFSSAGYDAASVDDVCQSAGVSKGAFYHHFASKQALFLALLEEWLSELEVEMLAARRPTVPETLLQMTGMLPMKFGSARKYPRMWMEFWLQASRDKALWKATIAPYRRFRETFSRMIEEGIAEGTVRKVDPQSTAQAILSMAVGLFLQSLLEPRNTDWQRAAEQSIQILLDGIRRERA